MTWDDVEHLAILLGVVLTSAGLLKMVRAWQASRDEAVEARTRQEVVMEEIANEFRPKNGRTLAQTVHDVAKDLSDHHEHSEKRFTENAEQHGHIHRRIDGLLHPHREGEPK